MEIQRSSVRQVIAKKQRYYQSRFIGQFHSQVKLPCLSEYKFYHLSEENLSQSVGTIGKLKAGLVLLENQFYGC